MERDSAAFRALVAKVMNLGALEIEDGWVEDGDVQVFKFVTKPVCLPSRSRGANTTREKNGRRAHEPARCSLRPLRCVVPYADPPSKCWRLPLDAAGVAAVAAAGLRAP